MTRLRPKFVLPNTEKAFLEYYDYFHFIDSFLQKSVTYEGLVKPIQHFIQHAGSWMNVGGILGESLHRL